MALKSTHVTVGSTATRLDQVTGAGATESICVKNLSTAGAAVYIGGSDVTTSNGFALDPGESMSDDSLDLSEGLYGIVASGTIAVHVLEGNL